MGFFDADDKTEQPTTTRRSEARESGNVAKSSDLNIALLMLTVFVGFSMFSHSSLQKISAMMSEILGSISQQSFDVGSISVLAGRSLTRIVLTVLPFATLAVLVGLVSNLSQVGFLFTPKSLAPELKKLNPISGFGRLFSMKSVARTGFGLLKITLLATVLIWTLWTELTRTDGENIVMITQVPWNVALAYGIKIFLLMGFRAVAVLLILAIFDLVYQRWQHGKDLMMTKQEVREEMLRLEGDPKMKDRRRKVAQQIAYQRMMHDVPKADVVITNPTHVAIAIEYKRESMSAPRCLAKGKELMARRIREVALQNKVPCIERPVLARALYSTVEIGQEIPPDYYKAVAEVLAYVYKLSRKSSRTPSLAAQGAQ